MADYKSSLPVRTEADADSRLQTKIVDATTVSQGLSVDAQGRASVKGDGVYNLTTNPTPTSAATIAHTRGAAPAIADQVKRLTAITSATVTALDVAVQNSDGSAITQASPLYVAVSQAPGANVFDYKAATAIAVGASDNHDYTVSTGKTLYLDSFLVSASGRAKFEFQFEGATSGVYTSLGVAFVTTACPTFNFYIPVPYKQAAGKKIRVIATNLDAAAQDLYSTTIGMES